MPAAKWSIDKPASRRAQPAVVGRGLSEGLGVTARTCEGKCLRARLMVVTQPRLACSSGLCLFGSLSRAR